MSKIQVKLSSNGIGQYLRSESVHQEVMRRAHKVAAKAGAGYEVQDASTKARARARVITRDDAATRAESKHGHLRNAIGGG